MDVFLSIMSKVQNREGWHGPIWMACSFSVLRLTLMSETSLIAVHKGQVETNGDDQIGQNSGLMPPLGTTMNIC